ncbi:MAG: TVP38/TMEM64 family protein [Clostridia bacterium]|nr:TVP38/TMEM64 family protein [Clostridia bacterium]
MGKKRERVKKIFADKEIEDRGHYSKRRAGITLSIVSVLMCVLSVAGIIVLNKLSAEYENGNVLRDLIDRHHFLSAVIMVAICIVQVIIAFIPGEVVEVAAGYAFGAWWGAVLCTVGITIGSIIAIWLARRFGRKLIEAFYPREKLDSMPVLGDPKKRNIFLALLFLIPGTPKDLLTYIIGLTEMSIPLYVLITATCRFPSIIMSTLSGDAMGEREWMSALWFFIITGVLSGMGYLVYMYIQKKTGKGKHEKKKDAHKGK